MIRVKRHFLELSIKNLSALNLDLQKNYTITIDDKKNFNINKFFYRQVGADHYWRDRLIWSDKQWDNYVQNINLETWVMKYQRELIGFYEIEFHPNSNEVELINMGIIKEHRGKKLGSKLLSHSINISIKKKSNRIWVHTCSLDHKYALKNYKTKGFKVFKEEEISFVA